MSDTYIAQSSDLTAVADAIREKGQTSGQLVFPDGFAAAIQAIKTGTELNFEIVGGTTQPENPVENTIWVNTETEITSWIFNESEPAEPTEGMLWIKTGDTIGIKFNALRENEIQVQIAVVNQYDGSVWNNMPTCIYQSGIWTEIKGVLFIDGDLCEGLTGGWGRTGYSLSGFNGTTITKTAIGTTLDVSAVSGSTADSHGLLGTEKKINIAGFKTLRVKGTLNKYYSTARFYIGVHNSKTIKASTLANIRITEAGDFDQVLDLPTDVDEVYVYVLAGCYTANETTFTCKMSISEISLM